MDDDKLSSKRAQSIDDDSDSKALKNCQPGDLENPPPSSNLPPGAVIDPTESFNSTDTVKSEVIIGDSGDPIPRFDDVSSGNSRFDATASLEVKQNSVRHKLADYDQSGVNVSPKGADGVAELTSGAGAACSASIVSPPALENPSNTVDPNPMTANPPTTCQINDATRSSNISDSDRARLSDSGAAGRQPPQWTPDAKLLEVVMSVGFGRGAATKALFYSGNASADLAVDWLLENSNDRLFDEDQLASGLDAELFPEYKMVFVVNCELKMGLGKVAAQVAHATLGLYKSLLDGKIHNDALVQWDMCGETKVVLRGDDAAQLRDLAAAASAVGLQTYVVQDAGRTQIAAGSRTVLSIFGIAEQVDQVTGKLKLF